MPIQRVLIALLWLVTVAGGQELLVQTPSDVKVAAATASAPAMKLSTAGTIESDGVRFTKLLPATAYDITLKLADGTVLQGVDLRWYNQEPVDPQTPPMTDQDRAEIAELVKPDKDFFNRQEILHFSGDHNRAAVLVRMLRDREFHSDQGGEIICRFDVWYFRFEAGGWMKIQQGQKQLRRDRFDSRQAYEKAIAPIRWTPELGGIKLEKGTEGKTIKLTWLPEVKPVSASSPPPTTQPAR